MKITNIMAVLVACALSMSLNACRLYITNDGLTTLRVWDPRNSSKVMSIAPSATEWTMTPKKDNKNADGHEWPALEFAADGDTVKYTLSMHTCSMEKGDNTLDFSMIKKFVKTHSEKNGDRFTVVEEELAGEEVPAA